MPIPILAIGAGVVLGAGFEYVYAGGHPTRDAVIKGGLLGGLPLGLGLGGAVRLGGKAKKLHKFGRHYQSGVMSYGSKVLGAASSKTGRWPKLSLRPEIFAITAGAGSNYVVGQLYDLTKSRRDQHASRSGRSSSRTSTRGASTSGLSSKRRTAGTPKGKGTKSRRLSSRGRTTPWCTRHNRRHFCKYTRKR